MKKIISIVLLVVGIGLSAFAAYGYFFSAKRALCFDMRSLAEKAHIEALAAEGTTKETAMRERAREFTKDVNDFCRQVRQFYQNMMLTGLGGLTLIIVSVVLLVVSRKRVQPSSDRVGKYANQITERI